MDPENDGLGTRSVHGPDEAREGSIVPPVDMTSTFVARDTAAFDDLYEGRREGYIYSRYGNPTLDRVARHVADLEGGEAGLLFASGMAAICTVFLAHCRTRKRVLAVEDTYGGTTAAFHNLLEPLGVTVERFPTTDAKALAALLDAGPADLVYLESPTNPTLRLAPLGEMTRLCREHGVPTAIDSTFASPVNSRPLEWGVDVVVHSATKYLAGHSDVTAGVVVGTAEAVARVRSVHKFLGAMLDPHAAFLLERGLKTLHLRVAAANANAQTVAEFLATHPKVTRVNYPGLPTHPQHALAREQMPGGFGGVLSFDVAGGKAEAARFVDPLRVIRNAASLGSVESLACLPVVQSHRYNTPGELEKSGITPGTVRLALGVEDADDLVRDVAQALDHV